MNKEIWKNPEKEKSLDQAQSPLWFWNDKLEKEELLRQLELKSSVGVKCTIPHARLNGGEGFIGGYLDEEWFGHIRTVLEYKKEKGEPVWLYDEMDWPAGTCNQTLTLDENNREKYLTFETFDIPAGQLFRVQLRELTGKSLANLTPETDMSQYAFNVFIVDAKSGESYDISNYFSYLMFGPELEFKGDKDAIAYVVKINIDPYNQGGNAMANYLDEEVTDKFIASTYDVYYENCKEYFGNTIQAVFNDETRMAHAYAWCNEFPEEFKKKKGYDLMKYLYQLPLNTDKAGRIRCDYFDVLAGLFQKNYFGKLQKWCQGHGIKFFAHLLGEETIFAQVRYSGDYLRQNRYLDIPGADHLGKGIGSLNIKFVSSGAHSYGKEMTAVEVFAGCGWDMTFEEYIRMITWMYQQGMQIIINHGFFYSDRGGRKNDWPPSQFFQWQGFDRMEQGNAMVRRLHYAMTGGYNEADILVYHPVESFWYNYIPDNRYTHGYFKGAFANNKKAEKIDHELQILLNGLLSKNMDFELLHQDALENFKVKDGKMVNRLSGQKFSVLILPMCQILSLEAAKLCEAFVKEGGTIYALDEIPYMGYGEEEDKEVKAVMEKIIEYSGFEFLKMNDMNLLYARLKCKLPNPVEIIEGCFETINNHPAYVNYLIDPYIHTGEDITGVMFNRYCKDGNRHTLFMNYGKSEEVIQIRTTSVGRKPSVWDTYTGEIREAEIVSNEGDKYIVKLELPHTHGVVLVTGL